MKKNIPPSISFPCIFCAALIAGALIFYAHGGFLQEFNDFVEAPFILNQKKHLAWIEVDFGEGKRRLFEGEVGGETYALLPALLSVAESGEFRIKVSGGRITEIAGVPATWAVYRNEKTIGTNINLLILQAGDRYAIRRE